MQTLKRQQMGIISLIIFAVMVIVGVVVYSSIDTSFNQITGLNAAASAAKGNVSANTYGAFKGRESI